MKSCQDIAELASAYADGELALGEWSQIRLHLWMCPACLAYIQQIELTRDVLERLPSEELPAEVQSELMGRFRTWVAEGAPAEDDPLG